VFDVKLFNSTLVDQIRVWLWEVLAPWWSFMVNIRVIVVRKYLKSLLWHSVL